MTGDELLGRIWSNQVEARSLVKMSPLAQVLEALLQMPTIGMVLQNGLARPIALMESDEILPGATLADVLDEEMGLHLPKHAVVLFEPVQFADAQEYSGREMGQILGEILVDLASKDCNSWLRNAPFQKVAAQMGQNPFGVDAFQKNPKGGNRQFSPKSAGFSAERRFSSSYLN